MNDYVVKNGKELKTGYTTGTCAAAASKACAIMLLSNEIINQVSITLPNSQQLILLISDVIFEKNSVTCAVTKYAGDDPDVTDGMKIFSKVKKTDSGFSLDGGIGIGRVTKAGLSCKVGEAAINPVPKKMIQDSVQKITKKFNYNNGLGVLIFAPNGVEIAKKTFNSRLGIIGGISILGTSGIVEPMSENAIIETIKLEISLRKQDDILFIAPGNYGLDFAKKTLGLNIDSAVKCSNFIGETLDFASYCGFEKILLVGHIGKLVKLAGCIMNTHSKNADCRNEIFSAHSALCGADKNVAFRIMNAISTDEIHNILYENNLCEKVYSSILEKILFHINFRVSNKIKVEVLVFSNENGILMQSDNATDFIKQIKEKQF